MADLFTLQNLFTLLMLILLQVVLGFDNLLYISIESGRVEPSRQGYVRRLGIGLAIGLRILLLVGIVFAIGKLQAPFFTYGIEQTDATPLEPGAHSAEGAITVHHDENKLDHGVWRLTDDGSIFAGSFNVHSLIVLFGGFFIIYTAFKEIFHMLGVEDIEHVEGESRRSVGAAVFWITLMNLVFSFDSILAAIALTDNVVVMGTAIIAGGVMMIVLADKVAEFLKKNRMYEVLGLFILLIVGVMLVSEGGHLAHLHFFRYEIAAMSKSTFYFVIAVMVVIDIVQSRYQKKLLVRREHELAGASASG